MILLATTTTAKAVTEIDSFMFLILANIRAKYRREERFFCAFRQQHKHEKAILSDGAPQLGRMRNTFHDTKWKLAYDKRTKNWWLCLAMKGGTK